LTFETRIQAALWESSKPKSRVSQPNKYRRAVSAGGIFMRIFKGVSMMEKVNNQFPLSAKCEKLTVVDVSTGKEIAVVTNNLITTAGDNIVVKLKPAD
jgi:predicted RNA-binding protein with EMAP domain